MAEMCIKSVIISEIMPLNYFLIITSGQKIITTYPGVLWKVMANVRSIILIVCYFKIY